MTNGTITTHSRLCNPSNRYDIHAIVLTLVSSVVSWLFIPIAHLGGSGVIAMALLSEPVVLPRTKFGHHLHRRDHGLYLVTAKISRKPLVIDVVPKRDEGLGVPIVNDFILIF